MKDVAKRVGVSVQTVSAVINQKEGITAKTRERVLQAVAELNYRPYSVARSLRTGQSHTLALLITDIANPYLASIVSTAEEYAYQHGDTLTVYNTHDDPQREAAYIQTAAQRWIDGVIFISTEDSGSNLSALRDAGIPSVAFERIPEEHTGPAITLDNQQTGYMATRHLLSLGHRQIAHISGPLSLGVARDRVNGYKRALAESGIDIDRGRIAEGRWDCESGEEAIQQILRTGTPFTALFAANDRVAIGAMSVLHTRGITI
ncbi:MAG: LacI family DNA-binding transcriptional regulator, partial [Chloroflexota bacterium]